MSFKIPKKWTKNNAMFWEKIPQESIYCSHDGKFVIDKVDGRWRLKGWRMDEDAIGYMPIKSFCTLNDAKDAAETLLASITNGNYWTATTPRV